MFGTSSVPLDPFSAYQPNLSQQIFEYSLVKKNYPSCILIEILFGFIISSGNLLCLIFWNSFVHR